MSTDMDAQKTREFAEDFFKRATQRIIGFGARRSAVVRLWQRLPWAHRQKNPESVTFSMPTLRILHLPPSEVIRRSAYLQERMQEMDGSQQKCLGKEYRNERNELSVLRRYLQREKTALLSPYYLGFTPASYDPSCHTIELCMELMKDPIPYSVVTHELLHAIRNSMYPEERVDGYSYEERDDMQQEEDMWAKLDRLNGRPRSSPSTVKILPDVAEFFSQLEQVILDDLYPDNTEIRESQSKRARTSSLEELAFCHRQVDGSPFAPLWGLLDAHADASKERTLSSQHYPGIKATDGENVAREWSDLKGVIEPNADASPEAYPLLDHVLAVLNRFEDYYSNIIGGENFRSCAVRMVSGIASDIQLDLDESQVLSQARYCMDYFAQECIDTLADPRQAGDFEKDHAYFTGRVAISTHEARLRSQWPTVFVSNAETVETEYIAPVRLGLEAMRANALEEMKRSLERRRQEVPCPIVHCSFDLTDDTLVEDSHSRCNAT